MRIVTHLLLALSAIVNVCVWIPFSSEALWPVGMVARELSAWSFLLNVAGLILAFFWVRRSAVLFLTGLIFVGWQVLRIPEVENEIGRQWIANGFSQDAAQTLGASRVFWRSLHLFVPDLAPQTLPMNIRLYTAPAHRAGALQPVLVNIHGGSWQHGGPAENGLFSSHMAMQGYAVFSIDYRRAPANRYPAQIEDTRAALDWIYLNARRYGADPSRIALVGRSAGGQLALLAAYTSAKFPIRAVVSFYGPPDLASCYLYPPSPDPLQVRSKLEAFLGGSPTDVPAAYRDASPIYYVHRALPPTLQIQGGRDNVTKSNFAREFHDRLLASGVRSLLLELPWSDHSFDFVYFGPGNILALWYLDQFLDDAMRHAH